MGRPPANPDHLPAAIVTTLAELGQQIATARLRRRWRQDDLAEKAGINPNTVRRIEAGATGTGIGAYAAALWALGLLDQLAEVARPERDAEGEALAAARLGERVRPSSGGLDDAF